MNKKDRPTPRLKKPWPTKKAMEQVYAMKLWGTNHADFYSGEGSHHPDIVGPYLKAVKTFLKSFKTPLVVCDLGCGDFNIGKHLVAHTKKYHALDIVPALIAHHQEKYKADNLEFHCLDLAEDDLPSGDLAILRQVLQHLSNAEIQSILKKLTPFKYVLLTEHLPEGDFLPNRDIISGQGTRLKKGSGVNLLAAPFDFKVKTAEQLTAVTLKEGRGVIVTTLYRVF
ncbi:class I SAM-dependent methyltransferase [Gelidibacter sp.]|uniref:class I SAM-dependent methyltransferase n=1 Tax=Gelidibacter sp. TaxID=2018083 RepID=UPI002B8A7D7E|nr:class I SAM-dependent methyltransferase [Gelidibacter sp.]HUH27700.1 class I SAM-dependent methyltransferase [Gelidibacter sp.]